MKYLIRIGENELTFEYDENSGQVKNESQTPLNYDWVEVAPGCFSLLVNGKSYLLYLEPENGEYRLFTEGQMLTARVEDEQNALLNQMVKARKSEPSEQTIKAPIPGLVTKVFVNEGDVLQKDAPVLTLEAMKMENVIKAPCACLVEKVFVSSGQTVQQNEKLVVLKQTNGV